MRALRPLEAASGVSILGSVLAVAVPAFVRNLHASRLVEPVDGLSLIASRATARAASEPTETAYPDSVPLTPEHVPRGISALDPPGTWDAPTWRLLGFSFSVPHSYGFSFESQNRPDVSVFRAVSHGDLDGDGLLSTFEIRGEAREGALPTTSPLESHREIE